MLVACAEAFGTTLHASHQNLRQNMACANRGLQSANPGNCQFPANHLIRFKSSAALCDANSTEVLSGYPADEKMKRLRLCVHCSTVLFLCFLEKLVPKKIASKQQNKLPFRMQLWWPRTSEAYLITLILIAGKPREFVKSATGSARSSKVRSAEGMSSMHIPEV